MTDQTAAARAAELAESHAQHTERARYAADRLVGRVKFLLNNGVDLLDPTGLCSLATDQVVDAIADTQVPGCCEGTSNTALIAELARRLAEAERAKQ